ncbi:competence protein ComF [Clostridium novyi A str. 4570]|uniref:Competence protein ComF n=1 Tax=Clostridium novyi A str. 4570 TaxID=1444290 RepID=A0AA89CQJ9_CLONO|nr:ComF family protein [Clostridium novyi]KGM99858.1 competence protein ComF [Clostridium novyi A str. 4570]
MGNEFVKNIKYYINCFLDIIYSGKEKCIICEGISETNRVLCLDCIRNMKLCNKKTIINEQGYEFCCYSSLYYSGITKELILNLKYKGQFLAGKELLRYLINTIELYNIKFDIVTYVPSSKNKLKERGYNQSKYLAKLVAEKTEKKLLNTLQKSKRTQDQIGLGKYERWENLKESFIYVGNRKLEKQKVLLVDDVLTTGATAFYCAKELKKNGADDVIILTVAKSNF